MVDEEKVYNQQLSIREHLGQLYIKAFLKMFAGLFVALQFFLMPMPFVTFIGLAVLFVMFFTLPGSYYDDEPYKAAESWIKVLFGLFVSFMLLSILMIGGWPEILLSIFNIVLLFVIAIILVVLNITFADSPKLGMLLSLIVVFAIGLATGIFSMMNPALSIFFLALAYFCNPPKPLGTRPGLTPTIIISNFISNTKKAGQKVAGKLGVGGDENLTKFANALYIAFAGIGGFPIVTWLTAAPIGGAGIPAGTIIVGLIWALSFVAGLVSSREARPYIGVMIIGIAILAFSFQYTGTIGTALFGDWWPQVQGGIMAISAPIGDTFSAINQGLRDTQELMTCPSCYYARKEKEQQEAATRLTEGGTVKSIELTEFTAINYAEGVNNLDPNIPLIGSIQLENQGTFTARNMSIKFHTLQVCDPAKYSAADPQRCWEGISDTCAFTSCTGTTISTDGSCNWTRDAPPGDLKLMLFKCAENGWQDEKVNKQVTDPDTQITVYNHSGWNVVIPFNYSFKYNSNVSLPIEIMNTSLFEAKLLSKEIQLKSFESRYSGGPVKISLFVQKQPLRDNEPSFGRISLINTGKGTIKDAKLFLALPNSGFVGIDSGPGLIVISKPVTEYQKDILGNTKPKTWAELINTICPSGMSNYDCYSSTLPELNESQSASWAFQFSYEIAVNLDKKSLAFVGQVDYNYNTLGSISMPIARTSIAQS